jgi:effector-binding domain-containing protein
MLSLFGLVLFLAVACAAPSPPRALGRVPLATAEGRPLFTPGAPEPLAANWKERMSQPYLYVEHQGDYRTLGVAMERLRAEAQRLDLAQAGPTFALYFDDPGFVPVSELRSRACLPVAAQPARAGALRFDVLPRAMVVYARVPGTRSQVARSYPALLSYLRELGWQPGSPIREVYLPSAREDGHGEAFVTEVQIPWTACNP